MAGRRCRAANRSISCSCTRVMASGGRSNPPSGSRAKVSMTLSISSRSRTAPGTIRTSVVGPNASKKRVNPAHWAVFSGLSRNRTRVTLGLMSLRTSSHLPPMVLVGCEPSDIAAGMREAGNKTGLDRIGNLDEHHRYRARHLSQSHYDYGAENQYRVWI